MTTTDDPADQYDAARLAGEKWIRNRWRFLDVSTQHTLVRSGCYSDQGHRSKAEPITTKEPFSNVEPLEYALGVLIQCVSAKVPMRSEKGASIPREALTDDVLTSCQTLLFVPAWHDPEFVRTALAAVAIHQETNALARVGPSRSAAAGAIDALLKLGALLLMPAALAFGLVSAIRLDLWNAGVGFYTLGACMLTAIVSAREHETGKHLGPFDRACLGWAQFRHLASSGVVGSGAWVQLEQLQRDGIKVPAVAFDLCAVLQSRMGCAPARGIGRSEPA
jgi:hypothetical protein